MRDELLDIAQHTTGLGGLIQTVKIDGTDETTSLIGLAPNRSVFVEAKFHKVIPEFKGTFGMPELKNLNTMLNLPIYAEGSDIKVTTQERNGEEVPVGIQFMNSTKDFKNFFRFMSAEIINERFKKLAFRGANWHVDVTPTQDAIQKFKFQIQANSDEKSYMAKVEDGNLIFHFGSQATHGGNFTFASDVTGKLSRGWKWPVPQTNAILNLPGDISMSFSDDGASKIVVDSGIAVYEYIIPAQQ